MTHPDLHVGADGELFLVGGTNRALDAYRSGLATWWRDVRWRRLVARRRRRAARLGLRYVQAIVPEKLTVYGDRLEGLRVDVARAPAVRLAEGLRGRPAAASLVDLVGPLRGARDEAIYLRTDTHWTSAGCHLAYAEICRAAGLAPRRDLVERAADEIDFVGDLGGKLDPPRGERIRRGSMLRDARLVFENAAAGKLARGEPGRHGGAHVAFANDSPEAAPLRVLLFGDSCSHVTPFLLTGMLAETVRRLDFIWSGSVDWAYVAETRPDLVVCELAERFMARVPADRFRVPAGERPPV